MSWERLWDRVACKHTPVAGEATKPDGGRGRRKATGVKAASSECCKTRQNAGCNDEGLGCLWHLSWI